MLRGCSDRGWFSEGQSSSGSRGETAAVRWEMFGGCPNPMWVLLSHRAPPDRQESRDPLGTLAPQ